ncbi:MAG: ATP-binding protein [Ichthyobacteriaceae bacterium]|nr:ATP-binding protein [Ichthyobacteriaceae bacterium]
MSGIKFEYKLEGGDFANAGKASSQIKKTLKQLNIASKTIKRVVVSLYEAEVNVVAHAYRGKIDVEITVEMIDIVIADEGPGIENIEQAMQPGFSTATAKVVSMGFGAGMGLPNMKKNTDFMNVESEVGVGTTVQLKVALVDKLVEN